MSGDLEVLTNFEGAMIGAVRINQEAIFLSIPFDPPVKRDWLEHDYRLHFCFGIRNRSADTKVVRVHVNEGDRATLTKSMPPLYISKTPTGPYKKFICREGASDNFKKYDFELALSAHETVYVSNTIPRSLEGLEKIFSDLAKSGAVEEIIFGSTLDNHDLIAYHYFSTGKNRPVVLITSGMHPPEPDTFATQAIMTFLGSEESQTLRDVFDFIIVPIVNPDGYSRATQAGNAAGVNIYWDFRYRDRSSCPEAYFLYKHAIRHMPVVYMDFHSYTFQRQKTSGPYCKPVIRYRGLETRRLVERINHAFSKQMPSQKLMQGYVTYTPSTLGEILTRHLNTVSYAKYHIHLQDGEAECKKVAVDALLIILESLVGAGMTSSRDLLVRPHGAVPKERVAEIFRYGMVLWNGYLHRRLYEHYVRWVKSKGSTEGGGS